MSPLVRAPLALELALLGFLRRGPLHGYELHRRVADPDGLGRVWGLKQANLYAYLTRLEAEGCVTSREQPQATRPARRLFRLTRAGKGAYLKWVQQPVARGRDFRVEFLVKLYLAERETPSLAPGLVAAQRETAQAWLADLQARAAAAAPGSYAARVCAYRLGQTEAMLAWLGKKDDPAERRGAGGGRMTEE